MLDTKKIIPKGNSFEDYLESAVDNGNNLIEALILMKSYIDFPKEEKAHKKRMKEFIKQFEVE